MSTEKPKKRIEGLRCPICLLDGRDPHLRYDHHKDEYFCQTCSFTGQSEEIRDYYKVFKQRYRQLSAPVELKKI